MTYLFVYRNNASNQANNFLASGTQYQELYITLEVGDRLKDEPEGEYTYVIVPMEESEYSGTTFTYEGNLLDTILSKDGEEIKMRDLKPTPASGTFRIGKVIGNTNTYDKGDNKTFYYEG